MLAPSSSCCREPRPSPGWGFHLVEKITELAVERQPDCSHSRPRTRGNAELIAEPDHVPRGLSSGLEKRVDDLVAGRAGDRKLRVGELLLDLPPPTISDAVALEDARVRDSQQSQPATRDRSGATPPRRIRSHARVAQGTQGAAGARARVAACGDQDFRG